MIDAATLDQLLEHASTSFGLAVLTPNPMRLHTALGARMREHRKAHPEAYREISIINSKSPRELYIVNRRLTAEERAARGQAAASPPAG